MLSFSSTFIFVESMGPVYFTGVPILLLTFDIACRPSLRTYRDLSKELRKTRQCRLSPPVFVVTTYDKRTTDLS